MENIRKQAEEEATIIDTYIANEETYIILPVRAIAYYSIVVEKEAIYYVKMTPLEIIKQSCLELDSTTYEGRRKAIADKLSLKYKTPMMLSKAEIFAFPTTSPAHQECCWVFQHPAINIGKADNKGALFIHLEKQIKLNISYHTLKTQFERAFQLRYTLFPNSSYFKPFKTLS